MTDAMVEAVARALHVEMTSTNRGYQGSLPPYEDASRIWDDQARAAIIAYEQALSDAGLVVVPREPTEAMIEAGELGDPDDLLGLGNRDPDPAEIYRAMISASPAPQNTTGKDE